MMLLVVTGVSTLIHLYSVSYMDVRRRATRATSRTSTSSSSRCSCWSWRGNFVLLIVGWAFVGAASYLLISFWYRRRTATAAGIKAFVMNVIGDVALVVAAFLLFDATPGRSTSATVFEEAHERRYVSTNDGTLVAACVLLL